MNEKDEKLYTVIGKLYIQLLSTSEQLEEISKQNAFLQSHINKMQLKEAKSPNE